MDRHSLYSGYNGSGKSYGVVANVVIPAVENGISICTNLEFTDSFYETYPNAVIERFNIEDVLTPDGKPFLEFFYNPRFDKCSLFILDEAQEYLPASLTARDFNQKASTWFMKIRHRIVDYPASDDFPEGRSISSQVVYLTPCADRLAKFVRSLISVTYLHTKLDHLGMNDSYRVDIYRSPVPTDTTKKSTRTLNGKYREKVYSLYRSQTGLSGEQGLDHEHALELTADPRKTLIKGILTRALGGLFVMGLSLFFVFDILDKKTGGMLSGDDALPVEISDTNQSTSLDSPVLAKPVKSARPDWLPPHLDMPSEPYFDVSGVYVEGVMISGTNVVYLLRDKNTGSKVSDFLIKASGFKLSYVDRCLVFLIHPDSTKTLLTCIDIQDSESTTSDSGTLADSSNTSDSLI